MAKSPTTSFVSTNPMPDLSSEEYASLEASIAESGMLYPIIKSAGPFAPGATVDGHNREKIAKKLGIAAPTTTKPFANEAEFRVAQIDANIARRQLTVPNRIMLAIVREKFERVLAAQRKAEGHKMTAKALRARGEDAKTESTYASREAARATTLAAEAAGLKRNTYEHGKFVIEKAPAEIREQFVAGTLSVNRAYKETKHALGLDATATLAKSASNRWGAVPRGKFGAILLTPAWRENAKRFEAGRVVPAELAAIDLPAMLSVPGIVAISVPSPWIAEIANLVLGSWKLRPVTIAIVRGRAVDAYLVAALGKVAPIPTAVFESHAQMLKFLDGLSPDAPGLAMFGEIDRAGWTAWDPTVK